MTGTEEKDTVQTQDWDGVERRGGKDRREGDRRASPRESWERRSGQDRRGHKLYRRPTPEE